MMAIQTYITMDLFHYCWNDEENRELWACFNAIVESTSLTDWIGSSATGGKNHAYKIPMGVTFRQPVAVSLPDDINLGIRVFQQQKTVIDRSNDRKTGNLILKGKAFRALNSDPGGDAFKDGGRGSLQDLDDGVPFAANFNGMIRKAASSGNMTTDELARMVDTVTSGGSQKWFNACTLTDTHADGMMLLDQQSASDESDQLTNLHSLNGLNIRLAKAGELDTLKGCDNIHIVLSDGKGFEEIIDLRDLIGSQDAIRDYFNSLDTKLTYDITSGYDRSIARRVYVRDVATGFGFRQYSDGTFSYRRRREGDQAARAISLRQVKRLLAKPTPELNGEIGANAPGGDRLKYIALEPQFSYECEVRPYRGSQESADGKHLMVLTPAAEQEAFWNLVKEVGGNVGQFTFYAADNKTFNAKLVNSSVLPWDAADVGAGKPTLLFYGERPQGTRVTMVGPVKDTSGKPLRLVLNRVLTGGKESMVKRYSWEMDLRRNDLPDKNFHHLRPLQSGGDTLAIEDGARLSLDAHVVGDNTFDFAQSASTLENLVHYTTPIIPHDPNSADIDIENEFLDDLNNFNCLNIFARQKGSERHLNPRRDDYPVKERKVGNRYHYSFHTTDLFNLDPPMADDRTTFDARQHYWDLYSSVIGVDRHLRFELEHTYGTSLPLPLRELANANFDFSLLSAAGIFRDGATMPEAFIDAAFIYTKDNEEEFATLSVDPTFLAPVQAGKGGKKRADEITRNIKAWRAIAELAFAKKIELRAKLRQFDFKAAIKAGPNLALKDALAPVDGSKFDLLPVDVTALLRDMARTWLESGVVLKQPFELTVKLTEADGPKISTYCHLIELQLHIERPSDKVPSQNSSDWDLVRELRLTEDQTIALSPDGHAVAKTDRTEAEEAFTDHLRSLAVNLTSIAPGSQNDVDTVDHIRKIIAGDGKSSRPKEEQTSDRRDEANWIVPGGLALGEHGDPDVRAFVELVPIGLRPIAFHANLGRDVESYLWRYLYLFDAIINCQPGAWRDWKEKDWSDHFDQLSSVSGIYTSLIDAITRLWLPKPDNKADDLNHHIRQLINGLKAGASIGHDLVENHLRSSFMRQPSLVSTSKAYLLNRIGHQDRKQAVRSDFFRMVSRKIVGPITSDDDKVRGADENVVFDEDKMPLTQALRTPFEKKGAAPWFGFVEPLDDKSYGSSFEIDQVELHTFERIIEDAAKPGGSKTRQKDQQNPTLSIPLEKHENAEVVQTPAGAAVNCSSATHGQACLGTKNAIIRLASRKKITDPTLLYFGEVEAYQGPLGQGGLDLKVGDELDLEKLLEGVHSAPGADTENRVRILPTPRFGGRSQKLDDTTLTLIFGIAGDEEGDDNWYLSFERDQFFVTVETHAEEQATVQSTEVQRIQDADLQSVLDQLAREDSLDSLDASQLEKMLAEKVVDFFSRAVKPQGDLPPDPETDLTFQLRYDGKEGINVSFPPETLPASLQNMDVMLLQRVMEDPKKARALILVVSVEVPVWNKLRANIVQSRNRQTFDEQQAIPPGWAFAPEFGQISRSVGPEGVFMPNKSYNIYRNSEADPEPYDGFSAGSSYSARDLIDTLLVEKGTLEIGTDDHRPWEGADLVITVFADSYNAMPHYRLEGGQYVETAPDEHAKYHAHPLLQRRIKAADETAGTGGYLDEFDDWFRTDIQHYRLEFQWQNPSNMQFFKIARRRVSMTGR